MKICFFMLLFSLSHRKNYFDSNDIFDLKTNCSLNPMRGPKPMPKKLPIIDPDTIPNPIFFSTGYLSFPCLEKLLQYQSGRRSAPPILCFLWGNAHFIIERNMSYFVKRNHLSFISPGRKPRYGIAFDFGCMTVENIAVFHLNPTILTLTEIVYGFENIRVCLRMNRIYLFGLKKRKTTGE